MAIWSRPPGQSIPNWRISFWFRSNPDALQALKDGRVEAFVQDDGLITYLEQKNPDLRIAGLQPFHPTAYGLGIRKSDKEWLDFVSSTLTKMEETGEYHKLLDKWFGRARGLLLYSLLETKGKKSIRELMKLLEE
jgi:ABC-type amino acid transport substrate-binding protein